MKLDNEHAHKDWTKHEKTSYATYCMVEGHEVTTSKASLGSVCKVKLSLIQKHGYAQAANQLLSRFA